MGSLQRTFGGEYWAARRKPADLKRNLIKEIDVVIKQILTEWRRILGTENGKHTCNTGNTYDPSCV